MDDLDLERFRRLLIRPDPTPYLGPGSAGFVGVVATGAVAGNYMTVTPVTVTGTETEGAAGTLTTGSGTVPVFNVGPGTAVAGDYLVCRFVDYRWAAARAGTTGGGGGATHVLTPCTCAVPETVQVHVANTPDPSSDALVQPCTLTWQAQPVDTYAPGGTPSPGVNPGYWGPRFTTADGHYTYRNLLICGSGTTYILRTWFTTDSALNYPGFTDIRGWPVGFPGNTCSPFSLTSGTPSTGFYSTLGITLTAP